MWFIGLVVILVNSVDLVFYFLFIWCFVLLRDGWFVVVTIVVPWVVGFPGFLYLG